MVYHLEKIKKIQRIKYERRKKVSAISNIDYKVMRLKIENT